jgi:UDP-glucose 4-epimerase
LFSESSPIPWKLRAVILVTGGCGFIGANLVGGLAESGRKVRVLDDLSSGTADRLPTDGVELVVGDVRDSELVARAVQGADAVVHLAAAGNVAQSVADPVTNFEINVRGALVALLATARAGVRRFLFASTGGALIGDAPPPVDETSLPSPISPYGASKLCGEAYCHAFRGSFGLETVALRFANVYGPGSDLKRGAVTAFITRALSGEPLVVYGDGSATRDFIHVDDLCAGIRAALTAAEPPRVVHLASERETSVNELAEIVLAVTGADVPVEHHERRAGEVERNFARARLASDTLGFEAKVALEDGIASTVDWFRARAPEGALSP